MINHPAGAMTAMTPRTGRDAAYEDLPRHRNQAAALGNLLVVALVVMVVAAVGASLMF